MKRALILLLILGAWFNPARSQTLTFDTASLYSQIVARETSGIHVGDTFSLSVKIINNSTNAIFQDAIQLYYTVSTDTPVVPTVDNNINSSGVFLEDTGSIYISDSSGLDTVYGTVHFNFAPPRFKVGPTVVVIWPICEHRNGSNFNFLPDTTRLYLDLLPDTIAGIINPTPEEVMVLVNSQQFFIACGQGDIKHIKLYDALGSALLEKEFSLSATIALDRYATGVYFAEVIFADNSRRVYKITHTGMR